MSYVPVVAPLYMHSTRNCRIGDRSLQRRAGRAAAQEAASEGLYRAGECIRWARVSGDPRALPVDFPLVPAMPPLRTFGKGNGGTGWTADELHAAILEKIVSHTSKPTERYREAFRLFGRPSHGLRHQVFREVLRSWGIELSGREARKVFAKFVGAKHADSAVEFRLFVLRLLGSSDFTEPLWNVERDKEAERVEWARKAHVKAMGVGASRPSATQPPGEMWSSPRSRRRSQSRAGIRTRSRAV